MQVDRTQIEKIAAAAPNFGNRWDKFLEQWGGDDEFPAFAAMTEMAHYVVDSYGELTTAEFPNLFGTVESLLQLSDPDLEGLIAVGLLEDIQNIASHRSFGAEPFRQWLGPRTLGLWDEVDGNMKRLFELTTQSRPKWWQFWRRRRRVNIEDYLAKVESPELRKIIEADYRKTK